MRFQLEFPTELFSTNNRVRVKLTPDSDWIVMFADIQVLLAMLKYSHEQGNPMERNIAIRYCDVPMILTRGAYPTDCSGYVMKSDVDYKNSSRYNQEVFSMAEAWRCDALK